jgi:vacuolar-type H+-ATPase subunit H
MEEKIEEVKMHKESVEKSSPLYIIREKEFEINARILEAKKKAEKIIQKAQDEAAKIERKAKEEAAQLAEKVYEEEMEKIKKEAERIEEEGKEKANRLEKEVRGVEKAADLLLDAVISRG